MNSQLVLGSPYALAVADAGSGGGGGVELPGPPLPAMICGSSWVDPEL